MINRTRGDLVRHGDRHGMVAETNRRDNTCLVQFETAFEWHSWWDLRAPNDDTRMHVHGTKQVVEYAPTGLARKVPHERRVG